MDGDELTSSAASMVLDLSESMNPTRQIEFTITYSHLSSTDLQYSRSVLSNFFQRFFSHRFSNFCRKIILKTGMGSVVRL